MTVGHPDRPPMYWELDEDQRRRAREQDSVDSAEDLGLRRINRGRYLLGCLADEFTEPGTVALQQLPWTYQQSDYYDAVIALFHAAAFDGVDLPDLGYAALRSYNDIRDIARSRALRRHRADEVERIWAADPQADE